MIQELAIVTDEEFRKLETDLGPRRQRMSCFKGNMCIDGLAGESMLDSRVITCPMLILRAFEYAELSASVAPKQLKECRVPKNSLFTRISRAIRLVAKGY